MKDDFQRLSTKGSYATWNEDHKDTKALNTMIGHGLVVIGATQRAFAAAKANGATKSAFYCGTAVMVSC